MSFSDIYGIAGSAMQAQTVRLDTVASNLANADSTFGSESTAYRALRPVFSTVYQSVLGDSGDSVTGAQVQVSNVETDSAAIQRRYEPDNPMADDDGYIYASNVDSVQEMADMMSASRSFESSIEVLKRANSMQQNLLKLGES
jgi:flagellar basal-body rod protein FlgC